MTESDEERVDFPPEGVGEPGFEVFAARKWSEMRSMSFWAFERVKRVGGKVVYDAS